LLSNRFGINVVILGMRSNKPYVDALASIVDRGDKPILVPAYVEDRPPVPQYVGAAKHLLQVGRLRPVGEPDYMHPGPERLFGISSAGLRPEVAQSANGDDPHRLTPDERNMFSFWEQARADGRLLRCAKFRYAAWACNFVLASQPQTKLTLMR
jgi:hypothetical protein